MTLPLIHRAPTAQELERLRLVLSVFGDGSGQERDEYGTRPGWRDIERAVAVWLAGHNPANKDVFDVVVQTPNIPNQSVGLSIKSKELTRRSALGDLSTTGRVYMELTNSPAKLWGPLTNAGISEEDFRNQQHAQAIGDSILQTVHSWHVAAKAQFDAQTHGQTLLLNDSVYLTVSYKTAKTTGNREYQLHSFGLNFPQNIVWAYKSPKCLTGSDPAFLAEDLFDWYGLSGGQLKYYPRASSAKFASARFSLRQATTMPLGDRAARYWPAEWLASGGQTNIARIAVIRELASLAALAEDAATKQALEEALSKIRKL